jgi:hypothetical protein
MDAPTLQPKFLKNGTDLGIVAVGFSGGQVRDDSSKGIALAASNSAYSAKQVSMPRPWPS